MTDLQQRMVTPRIGLLPLGHFYYWDQFPQLKRMGLNMYAKLRENLGAIGEVIAPDLYQARVEPVGLPGCFPGTVPSPA